MIQIGFSTSEHWLSRLIRWLTKSPVSHCFICFDIMGLNMVLEAGLMGVTIKPYKDFILHSRVIKLITIDQNVESLKYVLLNWLGKSYDFGGMIGASWVLLWRIFKARVKNPTQSNKALFCSELVVTYLKSVNYPGIEELEASSTTPKDLLEFFSKQGK